jgi:Spy/CpxP family protein refolding chaperone
MWQAMWHAHVARPSWACCEREEIHGRDVRATSWTIIINNELLKREKNMRTSLKKASLVIGITGALLLAAAAVGFSQDPLGPPPGYDFRGGPGGPGGPGPRDGLGPLGRELNLSDEQKAQVKKINDSFAESTKSLHEELRSLHESEGDPFSGTFDEATVRAAAEARAKIEVELQVAHAKMMWQIGAVLTTEQKAQLASRRHDRRPPPPPPGD